MKERDLVQQFFTQLLEKETLGAVTRKGGKFRSFLLAALTNFLANERRREHAQKRGGGKVISLEGLEPAERAALEPRDEDTPESVFERAWALALLEKALARLKEEQRREKNALVFASLESFLTGPGDRAPYRDLAAKLGISEANLKVILHRLRRRFGAILREEISATVGAPEEIPGEIQHLAEVARKLF